VARLTDIVLVKSDPIRNQSSIRAMQMIKSLRKNYSILALGWERQPKLDSEEDDNFQLLNLKAPYGYERFGPLRLCVYFPIFWMWVFFKLCTHRPKIIHACDLATILPCFIYKVLFRRKLIFDILDRYGMTYVPKSRNFFFKVLYSIVNSLEEMFARNSDLLITVSDKMSLTFGEKPKNCITIMNCPENDLKDKSRVEAHCFRILFTGAIRRGRGLETIRDIVLDVNDIQLVITGKIKDVNLQNEVEGIPNIKYHGFLDRKMLLELEVNCDVVIALYDLNLQAQYEYGMANKVLEAMMCGLPIITNISHELVNDTKCGIVVDYSNVQQIKNAILSLRDNPDLRKFYGNNGRRAFLEKYNWTRMEEKLYKTYEFLLNGQSGSTII
jgi:glycosyltransferase involved in cell wall biosynthesis